MLLSYKYCIFVYKYKKMENTLGFGEFLNEILYNLDLEEDYLKENRVLIHNIIKSSYRIYCEGCKLTHVSDIIFSTLSRIYEQEEEEDV